jgi:hypothetical protein
MAHLNFHQAVHALAAHAPPNGTYTPPSHDRIISWVADVNANRDFQDLSVPPIASQSQYPAFLSDLFLSDEHDAESSLDAKSSPDAMEHPLGDLNNDPSSDPNHLPHVFWDEPELISRFGDDVEAEHHILFLHFLQRSRFFTEADKQRMSTEASLRLEKRLWELQARCVINFR